MLEDEDWTVDIKKVAICGICEMLFSAADIERGRGFSKKINEHLCMPCQDKVKYLRNRNRAKFVE